MNETMTLNRSGSGSNGVGRVMLSHSDRSPKADLMRVEEARERIQADDCGKWDTTASRKSIRLKQGKLAFPLEEIGQCDECGTMGGFEQEQHLQLSSWATGQLCARLGIPSGYFRKCPDVLQDVQANYWMRESTRIAKCNENKNDEGASGEEGDDNGSDGAGSGNARKQWASPDENWLLRCKGDTVRALLSSRYAPLDNSTLLDTLRPLLDARYRVDWFGLSNESLHLRVIDPERTREVLPDDALSVGVHIANSEVGFRAVTVDALVYRLVCKNGLVRLVKGKSLLRQRHIHLSQPRFIEALGEAVEGALGEADNFIEQLGRTTRQPVQDVEGTLEALAQRWNLPDHLKQVMTGALLRESRGQSETVYGLVNAATSVAQMLPDEERYHLEVLAGSLAEHGVAAYAPRRPKAGRSQQLQRELATNTSTPDDSPDDVPIPDPSVFETAQEMFGAEIVGRSCAVGVQPEVAELGVVGR